MKPLSLLDADVETLRSEEANRIRDRIYAAVHEGSTGQWAARQGQQGVQPRGVQPT